MADAEDPSKKSEQAFFLALAAKGKDAWNIWRRDPANKDVRVTFAGIDFSEAPWDEIDFSGSNSATMRIFRSAGGAAVTRDGAACGGVPTSPKQSSVKGPTS